MGNTRWSLAPPTARFPRRSGSSSSGSIVCRKLKKELEFIRDSYGPGQTVAADFKAQRAEGGAAGGAKLRVLATVDGQTVFDKNTQATDAGTLHIEFPLPKKIERGDGQLAVIIDDGGARETQAKTIPINLGKIDVTFYPEGGELAAGLENRVYFVARNPQGKPVDLSGTLVAERPGDRGRRRSARCRANRLRGHGGCSVSRRRPAPPTA